MKKAVEVPFILFYLTGQGARLMYTEIRYSW